MTKSTQNDRVLSYIRKFGSINPIQALADLGGMRLASRIADLKRMGYPIRGRIVRANNRYGDAVCYAEYTMEETNNE